MNYYIATTRFNNETFEEFDNFHKNKDEVYYGCSVRIRECYDPFIPLFLIEMNNDTNKITGISIVKNKLVYGIEPSSFKPYKKKSYNRYVYKGTKRINREKLIEKNPVLVEALENLCFKGKSHLKRMSGISIITDKLLNKINTMNIKTEISNLYL